MISCEDSLSQSGISPMQIRAHSSDGLWQTAIIFVVSYRRNDLDLYLIG